LEKTMMCRTTARVKNRKNHDKNNKRREVGAGGNRSTPSWYCKKKKGRPPQRILGVDEGIAGMRHLIKKNKKRGEVPGKHHESSSRMQGSCPNVSCARHEGNELTNGETNPAKKNAPPRMTKLKKKNKNSEWERGGMVETLEGKLMEGWQSPKTAVSRTKCRLFQKVWAQHEKNKKHQNAPRTSTQINDNIKYSTKKPPVVHKVRSRQRAPRSRGKKGGDSRRGRSM